MISGDSLAEIEYDIHNYVFISIMHNALTCIMLTLDTMCFRVTPGNFFFTSSCFKTE